MYRSIFLHGHLYTKTLKIVRVLYGTNNSDIFFVSVRFSTQEFNETGSLSLIAKAPFLQR